MVVGIIFGIGCFGLMVRYSATKSVVVTEEHELKGKGNLEPLIDEILIEKDGAFILRLLYSFN